MKLPEDTRQYFLDLIKCEEYSLERMLENKQTTQRSYNRGMAQLKQMKIFITNFKEEQKKD